MEWIFNSIGTQIIGIIASVVISAVGGGFVGYKIGVKRTSKQKQVAGDDSVQRQEMKIKANESNEKSSKTITTVRQSQKAGNNSNQTQIGGINDERR